MRFSSTRRSPRSSKGMALVMAFVTLMIVSTLLVGMLKASLLDRRQLRAERDLRQTDLLVDAAVRRAAVLLAEDADYRGETWDVSADQIVGSGPARVIIAASRSGDQQRWTVHVAAEYPLGGPTSIRRSRTFTVPADTPLAQE